ncbi:hypothetical protein ABZP36_029950 [Zizania latifolia]
MWATGAASPAVHGRGRPPAGSDPRRPSGTARKRSRAEGGGVPNADAAAEFIILGRTPPIPPPPRDIRLPPAARSVPLLLLQHLRQSAAAAAAAAWIRRHRRRLLRLLSTHLSEGTAAPHTYLFRAIPFISSSLYLTLQLQICAPHADPQLAGESAALYAIFFAAALRA